MDHKKFTKSWLARLNKNRTIPRVSIRFLEGDFDPSSAKTLADQLMLSMGFSGIGDEWIDLTSDTIPIEITTLEFPKAPPPSYAQSTIFHFHNLGLSKSERVALMSNFYGLFRCSHPRYLSNGVCGEWLAVTESTFDRAFVGVGVNLIGAMVTQDED